MKWKFKSKSKCIIDVNLLFFAPILTGNQLICHRFLQFLASIAEVCSIVLFFKSFTNPIPSNFHFFLCCVVLFIFLSFMKKGRWFCSSKQKKSVFMCVGCSYACAYIWNENKISLWSLDWINFKKFVESKKMN